MTLSEGGACASEVVHAYRIAFVSPSATGHFSSTLDSRNTSSRAAKRMLQPPYQRNKVPLSAEPSKNYRKVRIFGEETSRSACCTTSEQVSAIFLRLPGLAPDRRGSKEGDHPTIYIYIYIYIASDRCEIRRLTVGLAGARPNNIYVYIYFNIYMLARWGRWLYIIESEGQWKPFWLATQQYPQNDWLGGNFPYTNTYRHSPHSPPL